MDQILKLRDALGDPPLINIELESRMLIPTVENWDPPIDGIVSIQYYRCPEHPHVTFRSSRKGVIESKETVYKTVIDGITMALSVEKETYMFRKPLFPSMVRNIERMTMRNEFPKVFITNESGIFTCEVEFTTQCVDQAMDIIKSYRIPYWPATKPLDANSFEIISVIKTGDYCLSAKIDGTHVMIYCMDENVVTIDDGGHVMIHNGSRFDLTLAQYVYEGEIYKNDIYVFDVLVHNKIDITKKKLEYRRSMFVHDTMILKDVYMFSDFPGYIKAYKKLSSVPFETDGYILTCKGAYNNNVYKSKPRPTVDLMFMKGYLYLATESFTTREPMNINAIDFMDGQIYEFDIMMNFVRHRPDKLSPNSKMPVEIDPITHIYTGENTPCLNYFHDELKMKLLATLPKTILMDIGSGDCIDMSKWEDLKFKKIYAVDPALGPIERKPNVSAVRCKVENIPNISYDSVTGFFIPWDNNILPALYKAKYVVLVIHINPNDIDYIDTKMTENGFIRKPFEYQKMTFGHKHEIGLSKTHECLYYVRM
jgi:hypothetical protein